MTTERRPGAVTNPERIYRRATAGGFDVWVGRGDRENDTLTFRLAEPGDFWLHVAGFPGSHVVVRNPERLERLPREVLECAAQWAAYHSKARGARGKVEVHCCRVADVSKRRGAPAGEVQLRRWDSLRVYVPEDEAPDPPDGESPDR